MTTISTAVFAAEESKTTKTTTEKSTEKTTDKSSDSVKKESVFDKGEKVCFVDTKDVKMYANSIEIDDMEYLVIDTLAVNSGKKDYEVSIPRAAVNGIEIYPTYSEDVYADDECDESIDIDLSNVIEYAKYSKVKDITDIELTVVIEDEDSKEVFNKVVHIYPYGEKAAVKFERKADKKDISLVDNKDFAISVINCEYIEDWGYSVDLYVQNKMDDPIYLEGEYFKLNDKDVFTWYDDVVGGKDVNFTHVEWSDGDLEDAEIDKVKSISFMLRVYDKDMDKMLLDKEVKLEP